VFALSSTFVREALRAMRARHARVSPVSNLRAERASSEGETRTARVRRVPHLCAGSASRDMRVSTLSCMYVGKCFAL
jgi:hypothetical protein